MDSIIYLIIAAAVTFFISRGKKKQAPKSAADEMQQEDLLWQLLNAEKQNAPDVDAYHEPPVQRTPPPIRRSDQPIRKASANSNKADFGAMQNEKASKADDDAYSMARKVRRASVLDGFSVKKAVIYSEIMKPKFEE